MSEEFDADLAALARELKRIFCEQKAAKMRRASYKPDTRNNGVELWMKVATLCRDLGARPEDFITAAFSHCTFPEGPFTTTLTGKSMRYWYELYLSEISVPTDMFSDANTPSEFEIKNRVSTLRNQIRHKLGSCDPADEKVLDELRSPIFGYDALACVLMAGDDEEVVRVHGPEAEDLLNKRPDIVRTLQEMGFPVNLILSI